MESRNISDVCQTSEGGRQAWNLRMSLGRDSSILHFIKESLDPDFLRMTIELEKFNTTRPRKSVLDACERRIDVLMTHERFRYLRESRPELFS